MKNDNGNDWRAWFLRVFAGIVLAGGAGWMTYVQGEVGKIRDTQERTKDANSQLREDSAVIREKVNRLEQDVKEIKEDQREQTRKLDELLRRVK